MVEVVLKDGPAREILAWAIGGKDLHLDGRGTRGGGPIGRRDAATAPHPRVDWFVARAWIGGRPSRSCALRWHANRFGIGIGAILAVLAVREIWALMPPNIGLQPSAAGKAMGRRG
jgi:hypothetical protein